MTDIPDFMKILMPDDKPDWLKELEAKNKIIQSKGE